MTKFTLVISFFRSLTLIHLEKSLYSLKRQTVQPETIVFFDNDSVWREDEIRSVAASAGFNPGEIEFYFCKHGDERKRTLTWANNTAIRLAPTDVFVFARADFIYDYTFCAKMLKSYANQPMSYATAFMWGMNYQDPNPPDLESFSWRHDPQNLLQNNVGARPITESHVDGPTFCTSKQAMEAAGWYDETLIGWGLDQQDLQTHMMRAGVQMKVTPEYLFFHMDHPADRDEAVAKEIWLRSPRRLPEIRKEEERLAALKQHTLNQGVLVMPYDENRAGVGDKSAIVAREFADFHGLTFFSGKLSFLGDNPWLYKLDCALAFEKFPLVIFVDSDVAFTKPFSQFTKPTHISMSVNGSGLCAGFFASANTPTAIKILRLWRELGVSDVYRSSPHDEATIKRLADQFQWIRDAIEVIPESAVSNPGTAATGSLAHHFFGKSA